MPNTGIQKTRAALSGFFVLFIAAGILCNTPIASAETAPSTTSPEAADQAALDKLIDQNQKKGNVKDITKSTKDLFTAGGYKTDAASANLPARVGRVINIVFAISGTLFLSIVIYSGIRWMTAGGNEEEVKKSRKRITRASIGLLIMLGAWIITSFVLRGLLQQSASRSFLEPGGSYTSPGGTVQIDRFPR